VSCLAIDAHNEDVDAKCSASPNEIELKTEADAPISVNRGGTLALRISLAKPESERANSNDTENDADRKNE
jgi:hypothetical protein